MTLAAGALTLNSVTSTTAQLSSAVATGGTAPYTYQWYRSTTTGFTPGSGNILTGQTALTLSDTGLIPNTTYYYKVVATDAVPNTATSSQLVVVTTAQTLSQNQFALQSIAGMVDELYNYNTVPVMIDVSQASPMYAGQAVKIVDSAGGVPKVVACTANTDQVLGFLNFDVKTVQFLAGMPAEISMAGNVMYLYATAAVARGVQVSLDIYGAANASLGGVKVGSTGDCIVGWAFDKAVNPGDLIRVFIKTPSFLAAA